MVMICKVLGVTFSALCLFREDSIRGAENFNVLCSMHQLDFLSFKKQVTVANINKPEAHLYTCP